MPSAHAPIDTRTTPSNMGPIAARLDDLRASVVVLLDRKTRKPTGDQVVEIKDGHRAMIDRVWVSESGELGTGRKPEGAVWLRKHLTSLEVAAERETKASAQVAAAKVRASVEAAKPRVATPATSGHKSTPQLPACIARAMSEVLPRPLTREQDEALATHPLVLARQNVLVRDAMSREDSRRERERLAALHAEQPKTRLSKSDRSARDQKIREDRKGKGGGNQQKGSKKGKK